MAMKADFQLEFPSEAEAKKAFAVLSKDMKTIKGTLKSRLAGRKILATAESGSFAGLRAMSNSFLRSARITYDIIDSVAGRPKVKAVEEENDSID